ncbi:hypothetical protein V7x_56020 [Crateriforma conspicua]|uniref:MotA/TolQ/ExbB proton channel domain-containing protein n=1 Tax=Crateriforma conspicua TaxID=2527996 RepID=A0A5C6FH93_9PLAN|nr:hypothetical protein V7x_56020 [Crateriforma conspicua]
MPRFSLILIGYCVTGFAAFFALVTMASRNDASFVSWLVNSLGLLYGTLLYVSGLAAFYISVRYSWRASTASQLAALIPFSLLPGFIGIVGLLHGYVSVFQILALSGTFPKPSDLHHAHATVLICPLVGLAFSLVSFAILAIAMVAKLPTQPLMPKSNDGG